MTHPLKRDLDEVLQVTPDLWRELRGKSLFITGGTGFVGTWLTETLCWAEDRFDLGTRSTLLTRDPDAFRRKAPAVANHPSVTLLCGEPKNFEFPSGKFHLVIHAATEAHRGATDTAPDETFGDDLAATRQVLEFARQAGTERFLFTSSGAVYGSQPSDLQAIPEDYAGAPSPMATTSAYGQAKRASEFLCAMYSRRFGFDALIARLFAFTGPHLPVEKFAVGNFVRNAVDHKPIRIESDGSAVRSYLYASDMAMWLWTILLKGQALRPYNVGGEKAVTVRELAEKIAAIREMQLPIEIMGRAGVPSTRYIPDTSRARHELQLKETISLEEGLRRTLAWYETGAMESRHI